MLPAGLSLSTEIAESISSTNFFNEDFSLFCTYDNIFGSNVSSLVGPFGVVRKSPKLFQRFPRMTSLCLARFGNVLVPTVSEDEFKKLSLGLNR
jgi:hypothetical protein